MFISCSFLFSCNYFACGILISFPALLDKQAKKQMIFFSFAYYFCFVTKGSFAFCMHDI